MKKNNDVVERMNNMEQRINEIYAILNEVKNNISVKHQLPNKNETPFKSYHAFDNNSIANNMSNQWTMDTISELDKTMGINRFGGAVGLLSDPVRKKALDAYEDDTYGRTLDALEKIPQGMSAEEVGKITNRSRNTESTYLWRLYLLGKVTREKQGNRIIYKIKDNNV
jgi:DNA-binding transcriptional ArsR family regulator